MNSVAWAVLLNVIIISLFNEASAAKILGVFPYQGKSHFFVFKTYLDELARRGHDVTVISHFPDKDAPANYKDISLAGTAAPIEGDIPAQRSLLTVAGALVYLTTTGIDNCEKMLASKNVQKLWIDKEKYDVVIVEQFNSDCGLGLAYKLNSPVVGITSHILMPWHYEHLGIPKNPSFVPFHFLSGGSRPSFFERLGVVISDVIFTQAYKWSTLRLNQNALAKYVGDVPPLADLARDIKFLLLYQNFPLTGSRLFPANVIEVGGYHVAKPMPLSKELTDFINGAQHGVVYVSFGSVVNAATLSEDKLTALISVFSSIPQRVIWKWDMKELPGKPKNVLTSSWLPQNDVLANSNVKAFVTHGGMGSTTEAIHHGVPLVVIPFHGDQPANAAAIDESGLGVLLELSDLNKETLNETLKVVLEPKFRENVKDLSRMWHDRPLSAMDTAIFWTEFAAKYSKFTFRTPAADVPCYEYFCLDILAFVTVALGTFLFVLSKCCCRSKKNSAEAQKKDKKKAKKA